MTWTDEGYWWYHHLLRYWTLDSQTQIQNHPWVGIHFQILDKYRKSSQGREIQFLFSASQLGGEICHPWFFIPAILTINLTIFIPIIITITLNITIAICIIIFITIMMTLVYGWVILSSGRGCQLHCQPSLFISSLIIVIIISCLLWISFMYLGLKISCQIIVILSW